MHHLQKYLSRPSQFVQLTQIIYCCDIGSEVAGVCKSIDNCDSWFTVCCQEGAVTSILQQEFVWGIAEDTKIPPPPPTSDSDGRLHACSCLNITFPLFSSLSSHYSTALCLFCLRASLRPLTSTSLGGSNVQTTQPEMSTFGALLSCR